MRLCEFCQILITLLKRKKRERDDKFYELTLHKWGYELSVTNKPVQFSEYLKLVKGDENNTESPKVNKSAKVNKEELLAEIERVRIFDQSRKGDEIQ